METEFFISERRNIILGKLRSRILKYIVHRYINSNNFTKKENNFKVHVKYHELYQNRLCHSNLSRLVAVT